MQNVNYGIDADCDTSADIIALLTADKNPVEICGIINKLLTMLYSSGYVILTIEPVGESKRLLWMLTILLLLFGCRVS